MSNQSNNSLDYLNQISGASVQKPKLFGFIKGPLKPIHYIAAGLLLLVIVVIIVSIAVNAGQGDNTSKLRSLAARLQTTETIVTEASTSIKSSKLKALNGNLQLFLTNTNRDIVSPLQTIGIDTAKLPADVIKEEDGADIKERLEDARLNAVYDSTYAREMSYQLGVILTTMKEVYTTTNNSSVKDFLQKSYDSLDQTKAEFANFVAQTE